MATHAQREALRARIQRSPGHPSVRLRPAAEDALELRYSGRPPAAVLAAATTAGADAKTGWLRLRGDDALALFP